MKKLFLSLMLIAGLATCFTSCDNNQNNNESTDHTQTFTLGEESYHVDNAISILNIQYHGSDVYNTIILSQGSLIGNSGVDGQGVIIIFKGDIETGTYELSADEETYPKYFVNEIDIEDIVEFNIENYEQNEEAYMATTGSMTIELVDGKYIITTDGIEVVNYKDNTTETSSVDFEGTTQDFTLATVEEESVLNESPVVTAGITHITYEPIIDSDFLVFFNEAGEMFGLISYNSWHGNIPEGQITVDNAHPLLHLNLNEIEEFNASVIIENLTTEGTINIAKDGEMYIVDIQSGENNLHYKGTLPQFDFFF